MYIKKMEVICLTQEEKEIWEKMDKLLNNIYDQVEDKKIINIVQNITTYLYDLNEYTEENMC